MSSNAEELLIQPFRNVVVLGTTALLNSARIPGDDSDEGGPPEMTNAAQSLFKEGERALKKILPIWNDQVRRYGHSFKEMMVQQGAIESKRRRMEDLLWDFDDVLTVQDFNQERYTALRAATKAFALELTEACKRFRPCTPTSPTHFPTLTSHPPFPPLPLTPPHRPDARHGLPPSSPPQSGRSVTVSEDRRIHIGREQLEVAEQRRAVESREASAAHESGSSKEPHTSSWLLSDSSEPNLADTGETSAKDKNADMISLLDALTSERVPPWSDASNDKISVAEGSIRSTETLNGSPPDMPLTPAPSTGHSQVNFKQDDKDPAVKPSIDKIIARPPLVRKASLTIGLKSSYHRLKGICQGGVKFRMGGHWESIVTTSEFSAGAGASGGEMLRASDGIIPLQFEEEAKIGRCGNCSYAHDLEEMEQDASLEAEATHTSPSGVRYRLRLLYKSHIRTMSGADIRYACLWCVQTGTTVRDCDATIFPTSNDLLRHISTHPQPLPDVKGVVIRYGSLDGNTKEHDYDLHLPDAAAPIAIPEGERRLPRATAVKDHIPRPGRKLERPPLYKGAMLEFLAGANIVAVKYPPSWDAKWCLGRHDGRYGAFPAKSIEMSAPREDEIPISSGSRTSVVTRWKWPPSEMVRPDKAGAVPWLQFSKGEKLYNIECLYQDYWCWLGTNRHGKTGVFPNTHVDFSTQEDQQQTAAGLENKKKRRGMAGLFGRRAISSTVTTSLASLS